MTVTPYNFINLHEMALGTIIGGAIEGAGGTVIDIAVPGGSIGVITGVAFINFPITPDTTGDWIHDTVEFLIGHKWSKPEDYQDSTVIAFPATFEVLGNSSNPLGWGVDQAYTKFDRSARQIRVFAEVAAKSLTSNILRMGFQVTWLSKE
jgi:hypothetical protein